MKTHKNLICITLCTLVMVGILIVNGTGSIIRAEEGKGLGWRQYAGRESDSYFSPLDGEVRFDYVAGSDLPPLVTLKLNISFEYIDCCHPSTDPHSWCNYNADDSRCAD